MFKNRYSALLLLALSLLLSLEAFAYSRRLRLNYNDVHMRGRENTLFLKRKIKEQYPNIRLRQATLDKIILIAKTKFGRGTATLKVGPNLSAPNVVDGNPSDFFNPDRYTFDRVHIDNPSYSSRGPWQIKLRGNFIIRKVVVIVDNLQQEGRRLRLDYNNLHKRGFDNTLFLKREIRNQYPNLPLRQFNLINVTLIAKSKHGMGQATLKVGPELSAPQTVNGNPGDFWDHAPNTFDQVNFRNPGYNGRGPWQIKLRGNFIINKVIVLVRKSYNDPYPPIGPIDIDPIDPIDPVDDFLSKVKPYDSVVTTAYRLNIRKTPPLYGEMGEICGSSVPKGTVFTYLDQVNGWAKVAVTEYQREEFNISYDCDDIWVSAKYLKLANNY